MTVDKAPVSPIRKMMLRMMNRLMLSCAEASRLSSESFDRELTLVERMRLKMHAAMCKWCRRSRRQLEMIREMIRSDDSDSVDTDHALPADSRKRINETIHQHL